MQKVLGADVWFASVLQCAMCKLGAVSGAMLQVWCNFPQFCSTHGQRLQALFGWKFVCAVCCLGSDVVVCDVFCFSCARSRADHVRIMCVGIIACNSFVVWLSACFDAIISRNVDPKTRAQRETAFGAPIDCKAEDKTEKILSLASVCRVAHFPNMLHPN